MEEERLNEVPPGDGTRKPRARVAVIFPCRDEAATIAEVVTRFRRSLPGAEVFVCDNGSSDRTAELAARAGATVVTEPRRGKGHAVRALLRAADAEVYLMADGDGTYPAGQAPRLVRPVLGGEADMAVGTRWHEMSRSRSGRPRRAANLLLSVAFRRLYGGGLTDVLSGYRAFSRRFVEAVTPVCDGFEVEAELSRKAVSGGWRRSPWTSRRGRRAAGRRSGSCATGCAYSARCWRVGAMRRLRRRPCRGRRTSPAEA